MCVYPETEIGFYGLALDSWKMLLLYNILSLYFFF